MSLLPDPRLASLRADIEKLVLSLTELIAFKDELLSQVCPRIEAQYMMTVGALECDCFRLDCQMRRLRRKLTLIHIQQNRQEQIDMVWIEVQLAEEFARFEQEIRHQQERLAELNNWMHLPTLTPEESEELRTKYRFLVKRLHPDTNPTGSPENLRLFTQCSDAYQCADLATIRLIYAMLEGQVTASEVSLGEMDALEKRRNNLLGQKKAMEICIENIKNRFPYNEQPFLNDPQAVANRVSEVKAEIDRLNAKIQWYTEQLKPWGRCYE